MKVAKTMRILLADPHPVMRRGLAGLIDSTPDMCVIAEATDATELLTLFHQHLPHIVLMDLRLQCMIGTEVICTLRAACPAARIIVFTSCDGEEEIYGALRAGARGYLLKEASPEEILDCIRAVYQGQKHIAPEVAMKIAQRAIGQDLTERELAVLREITQGKSNMEVAHSLCISEGTVKFHVVNILEKLDVADRTQAVVTALKRGIVHIE